MITKAERRQFRRALALMCAKLDLRYRKSRKLRTITISSRKRYIPTYRIHWEVDCYRVRVYIKAKPVNDSLWTLESEEKLTSFVELLRIWVELRPGRRKTKRTHRG
jgi:hypothetical protein